MPVARPQPLIADAIPEIFGTLLVAKMKTLEPLIRFRVKIGVQPGIEALVLAAHAQGTREEGPFRGRAQNSAGSSTGFADRTASRASS